MGPGKAGVQAPLAEAKVVAHVRNVSFGGGVLQFFRLIVIVQSGRLGHDDHHAK